MVSKPKRLQDLPKIAFAPSLPLFGVPSRSIYMRLEEMAFQRTEITKHLHKRKSLMITISWSMIPCLVTSIPVLRDTNDVTTLIFRHRF